MKLAICTLVAACACGILATAQKPSQTAKAPQTAKPPVAAPPEAGTPQFTSTTNEVIVPVTVKDDRGRFVSNLVANEFRILDEGKPQRIQVFNHAEKQPIVVGFLVDQSNGMKVHWDKYQEAIEELVYNLLPGDPRYSGYLITYSSEAELKVNTTSDSEVLLTQIRKLKPAGGAALYDAIYKACTTRSLVKGEPYEPRRIIIVIGDGHDSASKKTLNEVLEIAQRNLVTIYAVSSMAFGFANEDKDTLEQLTRETGGHVEYPLVNPYKDVSGYLSNPQDAGNYSLVVGTGAYAAKIAAGIVKAVESLQGEITTQYVLRYTPDLDPEGKPRVFRRIKVEVPSLPGVNLQYRPGYFPNPVAQAPAGAQ